MSRLLIDAGATVVAFDPAVTNVPPQVPEIQVVSDAVAAVTGAECLVVLTEWDEFTKVDLGEVRDVMASAHVVDARNLLDRHRLDELGFTTIGIGK